MFSFPESNSIRILFFRRIFIRIIIIFCLCIGVVIGIAKNACKNQKSPSSKSFCSKITSLISSIRDSAERFSREKDCSKESPRSGPLHHTHYCPKMTKSAINFDIQIDFPHWLDSFPYWLDSFHLGFN